MCATAEASGLVEEAEADAQEQKAVEQEQEAEAQLEAAEAAEQEAEQEAAELQEAEHDETELQDTQLHMGVVSCLDTDPVALEAVRLQMVAAQEAETTVQACAVRKETRDAARQLEQTAHTESESRRAAAFERVREYARHARVPCSERGLKDAPRDIKAAWAKYRKLAQPP